MTTKHQQNIQHTLVKLVGLTVAMFVFAVWVMPPIYTLFCEVTGINGKTKGKAEVVSSEVDTSRTVKVQFVAVNNDSMPWGFAPEEFSVMVHPGEAMSTHFLAKNTTDKIMVGQAIPSLVPNNAIDYFHKTECFCFNKQVLAPGEEAELGLQFIVDQELPKGVKTITLSYSLFDVTEMSTSDVEAKARELDDQLEAAKLNEEPLTLTAQ